MGAGDFARQDVELQIQGQHLMTVNEHIDAALKAANGHDFERAVESACEALSKWILAVDTWAQQSEQRMIALESGYDALAHKVNDVVTEVNAVITWATKHQEKSSGQNGNPQV